MERDQITMDDLNKLHQRAKEMIKEKKSKDFKLPDFVSVEYIGRDKGQVRLAYDGECIQFEWCPTNVAATALRAVEAYYKHCEKLLAKHLESSTPPTPPQGPDYSKLESGKHYWVLRSRIIHEKPDPIWVVAQYDPVSGGFWRCVGFVNAVPKSEILQIGERVPHPEDK